MDSAETVSETIREAILTILKPAATPLTAAELRVQLRVRSLRLAEYEILHALRCLQSEGLVRLELGRWSALHLSQAPVFLFQQHASSKNSTGCVPTAHQRHPSSGRQHQLHGPQ